jgi:release factor glutamine methyltransferase
VTAGGEAGAVAESWTVLSLIRWSADYLAGKGVPQGRLDAEHLLGHALDTGRLQLYLQYDRPLVPDELAAFKELLLRRARREPLQHIVGRAAFRELYLHVDTRVLIPRPETEELVDVVLSWARVRTGLSALDVGTGSACIALSLAHEGPFERVVATDTSAEALAVARMNADALDAGARVELRRGSLFEPVAGETFDVVVSNPPYVAEGEAADLEPEVRDWEPACALFAGSGGLDVLLPLIEGAGRHLRPGGLLAVEVAPDQAVSVADRLREIGGYHEPEVRRDLAGRRRIVLAGRPD